MSRFKMIGDSIISPERIIFIRAAKFQITFYLEGGIEVNVDKHSEQYVAAVEFIKELVSDPQVLSPRMEAKDGRPAATPQ